MIDRR